MTSIDPHNLDQRMAIACGWTKSRGSVFWKHPDHIAMCDGPPPYTTDPALTMPLIEAEFNGTVIRREGWPDHIGVVSGQWTVSLPSKTAASGFVATGPTILIAYCKAYIVRASTRIT